MRKGGWGKPLRVEEGGCGCAPQLLGAGSDRIQHLSLVEALESDCSSSSKQKPDRNEAKNNSSPGKGPVLISVPFATPS